jgi:50S ribosomal subunit-associated GTPase HflX
LQGLGVSNSKDRDLIRKKVKDLKSAMERERKQREKEQKAREKLERQAGSASKKWGSGGLFGK